MLYLAIWRLQAPILQNPRAPESSAAEVFIVGQAALLNHRLEETQTVAEDAAARWGGTPGRSAVRPVVCPSCPFLKDWTPRLASK